MVSDESDVLVDGSTVGYPSSTIYSAFPPTPGGGTVWSELENVGARPTIEVLIAPHHARRGDDPQLERALAHVAALLNTAAAPASGDYKTVGRTDIAVAPTGLESQVFEVTPCAADGEQGTSTGGGRLWPFGDDGGPGKRRQ
jgi:hypothetical protein